MALIERSTHFAPARSATSLRQLYSVWQSRRALAALDDAALADIGISRVEAQNEAARPFWDAPQTWRI
jgi:uncharacterized protein YjiS (DUF1127 family)